uniref:Teichuronic acid biosynthesis n=1 Tax=Chlorobium chlorochromatii (strain CaD3) TaxID=340177 RepID=Q3ASS6_CHLCH
MFTDNLISIITPVYNTYPFLFRLVQSVQMQKVNVEHIIIDDASTDHSYETLIEYAKKYSNIRLIRLPLNRGPVVARNEGIKIAQGRFLAFLDADDLWLPNKLEIQLSLMRKNNWSISFTDYRFISFDGTLVGKIVNGPNIVDRDLHFATRSGMGCLTVMVDRQKFLNFSFLETDPITTRAEDFWAWAELLKTTVAHRVPYDLARYTVVPGSRSSNPWYKAKVIWTIYREIEKMSFIKALLYYISFSISATKKRLLSTPRYKIEDIDGDKGKEWLDLVNLSSNKHS